MRSTARLCSIATRSLGDRGGAWFVASHTRFRHEGHQGRGKHERIAFPFEVCQEFDLDGWVPWAMGDHLCLKPSLTGGRNAPGVNGLAHGVFAHFELFINFRVLCRLPCASRSATGGFEIISAVVDERGRSDPRIADEVTRGLPRK